MILNRDRVTYALWDGYVLRNGETCDRNGKSRVGESCFAINEFWTDRIIRYPHKRAISEWLDECQINGFDAATERAQLQQLPKRKRVELHPKAVEEFFRMERGFGS